MLIFFFFNFHFASARIFSACCTYQFRIRIDKETRRKIFHPTIDVTRHVGHQKRFGGGINFSAQTVCDLAVRRTPSETSSTVGGRWPDSQAKVTSWFNSPPSALNLLFHWVFVLISIGSEERVLNGFEAGGQIVKNFGMFCCCICCHFLYYFLLSVLGWETSLLIVTIDCFRGTW